MTQIEALLGFLCEAVTPSHAVAAMSWRLSDAGFEEVECLDSAARAVGRGDFMTRHGSSRIAVRAGQGHPNAGLRLAGALTLAVQSIRELARTAEILQLVSLLTALYRRLA